MGHRKRREFQQSLATWWPRRFLRPSAACSHLHMLIDSQSTSSSRTGLPKKLFRGLHLGCPRASRHLPRSTPCLAVAWAPAWAWISSSRWCGATMALRLRPRRRCRRRCRSPALPAALHPAPPLSSQTPPSTLASSFPSSMLAGGQLQGVSGSSREPGARGEAAAQGGEVPRQALAVTHQAYGLLPPSSTAARYGALLAPQHQTQVPRARTSCSHGHAPTLCVRACR